MRGRCCSEVDGPAPIRASLDCRQSELVHRRCGNEVDRPIDIIFVSLDCGQNTCIESVAMRWTGLLTLFLCVSGLSSELLHRKRCNEVDRPAHICASLDCSQNFCREREHSSEVNRPANICASLDCSQNFCREREHSSEVNRPANICASLDCSQNFCRESVVVRWTGLLTFVHVWTASYLHEAVGH